MNNETKKRDEIAERYYQARSEWGQVGAATVKELKHIRQHKEILITGGETGGIYLSAALKPKKS